jgi:hypothetical protein
VSTGGRVAAVVGGVAIAVALIAYYVVSWVFSYPPAVQASATNGTVNLTLQTVAAYGHDPHQPWVTYLVKDENGDWQHSTVIDLPANTLVHVTVYNYDGQSGLRNPLWSKPRGVEGGTIQINGKTVSSIDPAAASHTFAVPGLGLSVPIFGVADDAPNQCATPTPCPMSTAHITTVFTFRTGKPGHYRWQCFVPCAAGFINGFGGPMQTVGYMDGFLNVA